MTVLLSISRSDLTPEALVASAGEVLTRFDHRTQDSGNVSWLVSTPAGDLFVKCAGEGEPLPGTASPYLDRPARVELLRSAIAIARSVDHPALARLRNVIETPRGPALVYDCAPGELVGVPAERREDPDSSYVRFAVSPPRIRLAVFDQLLDAHRALEDSGWVACDLYDGCLMVDLESGRLTLIDLDTYRRGPSTNDIGRMFGSSRFMAPEEFMRGAPLDSRTTVFTLGRLLHHFGTSLSEDLEDFCGGAHAAAVVERATRTDRAERFADVAELVDSWRAVRRRPGL